MPNLYSPRDIDEALCHAEQIRLHYNGVKYYMRIDDYAGQVNLFRNYNGKETEEDISFSEEKLVAFFRNNREKITVKSEKLMLFLMWNDFSKREILRCWPWSARQREIILTYDG